MPHRLVILRIYFLFLDNKINYYLIPMIRQILINPGHSEKFRKSISDRNSYQINSNRPPLLDRSDERRCGSQQIDRTDEKIDINNWTVRTYLDRSVDAQISKHKHRNKRIF